MTDFIRTPDANFAHIADFPYAPNYHSWQDMRVHYVDEGPKDGPVMLLMHGMPAWSYLYRDIIPQLVEAGYRCIAPDHLGFGRSDKPTDFNWYTIARHTEVLTSLIYALDLKNITLVCQDWGGPTGLAQSVYMPERFDRLCIMNTWLHHPEYEYSDGIRNWNAAWHEGGRFHRTQPDLALLLVLSAGLAGPEVIFPALMNGTPPAIEGKALEMYEGFAAPYKGLPDQAFNGYRKFPLSIPLDSFTNGNAAAQTHHYKSLLQWRKPVYFIWGCADDVFTEAWGRTWAERMNASFDGIPDAGHFLQNSHGKEVASILLGRISAE
ncbi:MAG: alpha/beta fold hydrolase [Pseudomonadales bacterium]|jgi:haloalkane dehalogenase|nr:alpha/beta fold hydrolase [Pseudomonadales bacterium]